LLNSRLKALLSLRPLLVEDQLFQLEASVCPRDAAEKAEKEWKKAGQNPLNWHIERLG
jgi:hypothetical protein